MKLVARRGGYAGRKDGSLSGLRRVAFIAALIAALTAGALILSGLGGGGYEVTAKFINAGQIVKGNPVQSGGTAIGTVKDISITQDGQAEIKFSIEDKFAPLREGTRAAIKQFSQSGIANRYIDLSFPPNGGKDIEDGGHIGIDKTRTAVDLDELFNTLDPKTRKALQEFVKGNARQFQDAGPQANEAFKYLNPALATSSRLFNELTRDKPTLERFLVDSSRLVTALAERRDDLSGLIANLNGTTRALGNQKAALADSIERLPPFMRRANTTFVNLRAALDDVDPLVEAAKPVAVRLNPFLDEARAFASDAKPTVADLRKAVKRPGTDNDLINLLGRVPPLADIAVEAKARNGANRPGAFPQASSAFKSAAPIIGEARPYTTDFLGWLDDFSTTGGGFDALGAYARAFIGFGENLTGPARKNQFKRCPGASEEPAPDGSNVLSDAEKAQLDCLESARATGNVP
jgi:phospholipid/cholesterol/gamma-HCH transport system substrate-binding protein